VFRIHFFQIFERMFCIGEAGVDEGQTARWDRQRWVFSSQILLEKVQSLLALSRAHVSAGKKTVYAATLLVFLDHRQSFGGPSL
jgi:hypothetical protein